MYDPRAEAKEFLAENQAEAVAKACDFFGREESDLAIHVIRSGEVSGLAARAAIIAVPQGARQDRRSAGRRNEAERRVEAGRQPPPAEDSIGTASSELSEVGEFVLGLVERLDLGPFELNESQEEENLVLCLRGPAARKLSGEDARAVGAIQLVAGQVRVKQGPQPGRTILDVEGDTEQRIQHLERAAEWAAERARGSGRGVALDPMNPRDRRMVHVALKDVAGVATMSVGTGRYRQVVVVPEGAPEYEEARRHEAAARQEHS